MTTEPTRRLQLQIVSDVICPWCYIGKYTVDRALPLLAEQGVAVEIEWLPYQLNPTMPVEGMDRKTFRTERFGSWDKALAMDARAVEAGRAVGARFDYPRQSRTPNTLAAHALIRLAGREGGAALQSQIKDALMVAYFAQGEDIGDEAVLERIAAAAGIAEATAKSRPLRAEVTQIDQAMRSAGLSGVPSYVADGKLLFSGAASVEGYVQRFAAAARSPG
jgi:predicted DsbA family dithiol-disulfide isomerase